MDNYQKYFENILSRTWLGQKTNLKSSSIEKAKIEELFFEKVFADKIVIIGKTEKFNFILECFDSDGFIYSNGLFNEDLVDLLNGYKDKENLFSGVSVEKFVEIIKLQKKLENILSTEEIKKVKRVKI